MNIRLLCRFLGVLALLVGGFMLFSLPWAFPAIGRHTDITTLDEFESRGFWGLVQSTLVCGVVGAVLLYFGRSSKGRLYRKEAMAIVGLSWMLATLLGALPYLLSGTIRGTSVRIADEPSSSAPKLDCSTEILLKSKSTLWPWPILGPVFSAPGTKK